MQDDETRLDILIEGAKASGLTIDFLHDLTDGLSLQALRKVIGNASSTPANRKSSERPYALRRASAPSSDRRDPPVSQLDS